MQVVGLRYCHGHRDNMLRAWSKLAYRHCHICGGSVLLLDTNSICEGDVLSVMPRHRALSDAESMQGKSARMKVSGAAAP